MVHDESEAGVGRGTGEQGASADGSSGETGPGAQEVEAPDGGLVLEDWDDLIDLTRGSRVLVPLDARLGAAVWTWSRTMHHDNPPGRLSRGVRDLLLAMDEHEMVTMLRALHEMLAAFAAMLEASRPASN